MMLHIGDRITFRAVTREGAPKLTRVVNGFYLGQPTVRAHGHADFIVKWTEILAVNGTEGLGE